jgi:hypothetical protein
MDATWKPGEDYFIRLRHIKDQKLTQDDIEHKVISQLMQIIRFLPLRTQSYGSYNTLKIDVLEDLKSELIENFNEKRLQKWDTKTNEERIKWSSEINELASILAALDYGIAYVKEK